MAHDFQPRDRVTSSGTGRTATWSPVQGTVTRTTEHLVFVHWDGTSYDDEMQPADLRLIENDPTTAAARLLGQKGGRVTSDRKTIAVRANGRQPVREGKRPRGRPRKVQETGEER